MPPAASTDPPRPQAAGPCLGHGIGLRRAHWPALLDDPQGLAPAAGVDFFELLTENHLSPGPGRRAARRAAARRPIVLHGTALNIGGLDPLDRDYLAAVAALAHDTGARWISDHLCFSGAHGEAFHDLIPVPRTVEALDHVSRRIDAVRGALPDVPFALENPSYYIQYAGQPMDELTFWQRLIDRTGVRLLLDINNVYVNCANHPGGDPDAFVDGLPAHAVQQIHLAGHTDLGDVIIDTHGAPMIDPVVALYQRVLRRIGPVSTLFEWDNDLPALPVLLAENARARAAAQAVLGPAGPGGRL